MSKPGAKRFKHWLKQWHPELCREPKQPRKRPNRWTSFISRNYPEFTGLTNREIIALAGPKKLKRISRKYHEHVREMEEKRRFIHAETHPFSPGKDDFYCVTCGKPRGFHQTMAGAKYTASQLDRAKRISEGALRSHN